MADDISALNAHLNDKPSQPISFRVGHNFQTHIYGVRSNFDDMAASPVSVEYLSTGANRQTAVADWSRGGILAFGADINVALWRPAVSFGAAPAGRGR